MVLMPTRSQFATLLTDILAADARWRSAQQLVGTYRLPNVLRVRPDVEATLLCGPHPDEGVRMFRTLVRYQDHPPRVRGMAVVCDPMMTIPFQLEHVEESWR